MLHEVSLGVLGGGNNPGGFPEAIEVQLEVYPASLVGTVNVEAVSDVQELDEVMSGDDERVTQEVAEASRWWLGR